MVNNRRLRKLNFRELQEDPEFINEIVSYSEGNRILSCIQCGTCRATCPVSEVMDYAPRQIFAMIREGMKNKVLLSVTPWICASCYKCTVNCPAQIKITEVMYKLKRMSIKNNIVTKKTDANRFYSIFVNQIKKYGRTYELGIMIKYLMFNHPIHLLKQTPYGLRMMISGFISLFPHKIKNIKAFNRITDHAFALDKA